MTAIAFQRPAEQGLVGHPPQSVTNVANPAGSAEPDGGSDAWVEAGGGDAGAAEGSSDGGSDGDANDDAGD